MDSFKVKKSKGQVSSSQTKQTSVLIQAPGESQYTESLGKSPSTIDDHSQGIEEVKPVIIKPNTANALVLDWMRHRDHDNIKQKKNQEYEQLLAINTQINQQYMYSQTGSKVLNTPISADNRQFKLQSNTKRDLDLEIQKQKPSILTEKLKQVLILKNNVAGLDSEGLKQNKEILSKYADVIETIVEKRENKKSLKKEQPVPPKFEKSQQQLEAKETKSLSPKPLTIHKKDQIRSTGTLISKETKKKPQFKIVQLIEKYGKPDQQETSIQRAINTIVGLGEREIKLQQNPLLQYHSNKNIGNYYVLKLDKNQAKDSEKQAKTNQQQNERKKTAHSSMSTISKINEDQLSYLKSITLKNSNVNTLMNYYNIRAVKRDLKKLNKHSNSVLQPQSTKSIRLPLFALQENDTDSDKQIDQPFNFVKMQTMNLMKQKLSVGLKNRLLEEKKISEGQQEQFMIDQILYKSLTRKRLRSTPFINRIKQDLEECIFDKSLTQIDPDKKRIEEEKIQKKFQELSMPKHRQSIQFFGIPKTDPLREQYADQDNYSRQQQQFTNLGQRLKSSIFRTERPSEDVRNFNFNRQIQNKKITLSHLTNYKSLVTPLKDSMTSQNYNQYISITNDKSKDNQMMSQMSQKTQDFTIVQSIVGELRDLQKPMPKHDEASQLNTMKEIEFRPFTNKNSPRKSPKRIKLSRAMRKQIKIKRQIDEWKEKIKVHKPSRLIHILKQTTKLLDTNRIQQQNSSRRQDSYRKGQGQDSGKKLQTSGKKHHQYSPLVIDTSDDGNI